MLFHKYCILLKCCNCFVLWGDSLAQWLDWRFKCEWPRFRLLTLTSECPWWTQWGKLTMLNVNTSQLVYVLPVWILNCDWILTKNSPIYTKGFQQNLEWYWILNFWYFEGSQVLCLSSDRYSIILVSKVVYVVDLSSTTTVVFHTCCGSLIDKNVLTEIDCLLLQGIFLAQQLILSQT